MLSIIGILVVFIGVFGGYILAGGKMGIIVKMLPFEFMMIGGAGIGAFFIANSGHGMKHVLHSFGKVFKGAKWSKDDYRDMLCLLFALTKLMKIKGLVAVEQHIEKPEDSEIFNQYPKILADHFALDLICDNIRMMTMDLSKPNELEDAMDALIEKYHKEEAHPSHALQTLADGLPALGIVAAVLGVIKTMASINEPPEILGKMIGGALVGTFLGVFLSYGLVAPFAGIIGETVDEEMRYYKVIRTVLVSYLRNNPVQVAVELGRGEIPSHLRPTFYEVEEALENIPSPT